MLGLGWTEMLVIGVAALIFIGPKDLPVVMKRLGQLTGQIRRMGNEFQREINKTTGLDEVRNLRDAITNPLKQTTDQIRRDFNTLTSTGEVKPTGILKPSDPKAESIVAEIHAAAGMTPPAVAVAKPKKPAARKAPAKAKAAPTAPVVSTELAPIAAVAAVPVAKPARKPAVRKAAIAADAPVATPKRTVAAKSKAAAPVVAAEAAPAVPKKRAVKKPATPPAQAGTE